MNLLTNGVEELGPKKYIKEATILNSFTADDPEVIGKMDEGIFPISFAAPLSTYVARARRYPEGIRTFDLSRHYAALKLNRDRSPHFRLDDHGVLVLNADIINDVSIEARDKLAWTLGLNEFYDGSTEFPGLKQQANLVNLLDLARREYSMRQVRLEDVLPYVERFLNLKPAAQEIRTMVFDKVMDQVIDVLEVERFKLRR